ncbi:hypothetical protein PT277_07720 [Acetobacteraceae bacterium ESL0709]|nr:hypothetical protein [Acetobacteraceae bacterium ESL0697]MDF7678566.1 hypothetical protein [Acetobacteraceae bacterium ESL0709]
MTDHDLITGEEQKTTSGKVKPVTVIGIICAIIASLLVLDTILYFQTQKTLTHQIVILQKQVESMDAHARLDITQRGGWPVGSWIRIESPQFRGKIMGKTVSFLGTTAQFGGLWPLWLRNLSGTHGIPLRLKGKSVLAFPQDNGRLLVFLNQGHLFLDDSREKKNFRIPFSFNQTRIELQKQTHTLGTIIIDHLKGTMLGNISNPPDTILALEVTADRQEIQSGFQNHPLSLESRHIHLITSAAFTDEDIMISVQNYSFQLPSWKRPSSGKDAPPPSLSLNGKGSLSTKSGSVTLTLDRWRDLIKSGYQRYGEMLTGNPISPESEEMLDKFLSYGQNGGNGERPFSVTATVNGGRIDRIDLGRFQPFFQLMTGMMKQNPLAP